MAQFRASIIGTNAYGDTTDFGFGVDDPLSTSAQDVADAVATAWNQHFPTAFGSKSVKELYRTDQTFTTVRAYRLANYGNDPALQVAEAPLTQAAGSASVMSLPAECAICVSLLTGVPGRSYRGRMYFPATTYGVLENNGTLTTPARQAFSGFTAALFGDVNNGQRFVSVISRTKSLATHVTAVSVGSHVDTQSRRQNAGPETYYVTAVSQI